MAGNLEVDMFVTNLPNVGKSNVDPGTIPGAPALASQEQRSRSGDMAETKLC